MNKPLSSVVDTSSSRYYPPSFKPRSFQQSRPRPSSAMEYQPKKSRKTPCQPLSRYKTAATFSNLNRFHCHNSLSLPQKNSYNSSSEHRRRDAHTPAYLKTLPPSSSPYAIAERGYVSPASLSRLHLLLLLLCPAVPDPGTRTGMNGSAPEAPGGLSWQHAIDWNLDKLVGRWSWPYLVQSQGS